MPSEKTESVVVDYDQKTAEELVFIAVERNVPDVEIFRKSELRRLLRAMDAKDESELVAVRKEAVERTKNQSARADSVMARAAANAGRPAATKPKADKALEKPVSKQDGGASQQLLVDERGQVAKRDPIFLRGDSGANVLERIRARQKATKPPEIDRGPQPRKSLALQAVEQAAAGGGKPIKPETVAHYEVLESTRYFAPHGTFQLNAGSIVSALTHDMESLRSNGAKLRQIDPTKTTIEYSELGHPKAMKTVATEERKTG